MFVSMDTYGISEGNMTCSPLTLSDTDNTDTDLEDPIDTFMDKQNALAAERLQKDFDTFYFACNHCPRILMSLHKLKAHQQAFHPPGTNSLTTFHQSSPYLRPPTPPSPSYPPLHMPKLLPQVSNTKKQKGTIKFKGVKNKSLKRIGREGIVGSGGGGGGDYACKFCHTSFASPWNLKVHLQTIHENARPFSCPTCGKSFKQRIHLLGHSISTHSNYKPFKCEMCTVAFSKKWNLFDHVRKHHKGTKTDLERLKFKYSKRKKGGDVDD